MPTPEDVPMDENDAGRVAEGSQDESKTPSREVLKKLLNEVEMAEMEENEMWYLISQKWWNSLIKAVRDGFVDDVGPIDNSQISECRNGSFFLKQRLAEQVDYTPVPEILFKRLERFYHIDDDRRDYIQRRVVRKDGKLCIEVYPRIVHITSARNRDIKADLVLRPDDTMVSLRERVIGELSLSTTDNIRFYVMNGENYELIDTAQSIDSYFDTVQKVVVDVEEDGEFFIKGKSATPKSLFGTQSSSSDSEDDVENVVRLPKPNRHRQFSTSTVSSTSSKLLLPLWAVWLSFREAWWGFSQLWPDTIREAVAFLFGWWILRPPSYSSRFAFWREIVV